MENDGEKDSLRGYRLGCPMWGEPSWRGSVWPRDVAAREALAQYSSVFNTVEGNTTFYALPSSAAVPRWLDLTPPHFRFCFKWPRSLTHEAKLLGGEGIREDFLLRLEPLRSRLGPTMLQLPASFGPDRLPDLDHFLQDLPTAWKPAVELRHKDFYDHADQALEAREVLSKHGCERITMDTRALRAGDPRHPGVVAARHQKPDLPVNPMALTSSPFYRWVGHPDPDVNRPFLHELAQRLVAWMAEGRTPYIMVHCPDTARTPWMARELHHILSAQAVMQGLDVGRLPAFPIEEERKRDRQLSLF